MKFSERWLTADRSTVRELSVKELKILEQFKENFGKDSDVRRDWWQEDQGTTEDEMAGWHHWLNGRGDGQGGLVCCNSWGRKESDTTEQLNRTELRDFHFTSHGIWIIYLRAIK